jgi:hypothetical protein
VRFFGRLMMTETTAEASKSSKSKSICTALCSVRFGEPACASEFFLSITFFALSNRALETGEFLFYRKEWCWTSIPTSSGLVPCEFSPRFRAKL